MAFKRKQAVRLKIVLINKMLEQFGQFFYMSCNTTSKNEHNLES